MYQKIEREKLNKTSYLQIISHWTKRIFLIKYFLSPPFFEQKLGCFFSLFHMPLSHFMSAQIEFHICYTTFSPLQNG